MQAVRGLSAAGAAVAILLSVATAQAASTVNVTLSGEGGGKMTMVLDKASVSAGTVNFVVKNNAMTETHGMVVVKLKSKDQALPLNTAKHRIDEKKLKSMGEVADLKAGATDKLEVKLEPGNYILLCNIKGHYEAGMWSPFEVTKQ
jgi:uncharacterized cupredoxin-like copper-binding protein